MPTPAPDGTASLYLRFVGDREEGDGGSAVRLECLIEDGQGGTSDHFAGAGEELADWVSFQPSWVADPSRVVAFVPAADVLALSYRVPGRSIAQVRRAAPYAIEEFTTEDIDAMHVAVGPVARNEPVPCLVAPRAKVQAWLATLEAVGIVPGHMTADAMAVPAGAGEVRVLFDGESALVRTQEQIAEVDLPNLAGVLEGIHAELTDDETSPTLQQINGELSAIEISQCGFDWATTETIAVEDSLLAHLAVRFRSAETINLLQGDFAVKRRSSSAWRGLRSVAAVAGIWLTLALIAFAAEGLWATYKTNSMREEANALYRRTFGVNRAPPNPASRMRGLLGQTRNDELGFHSLLGGFADVVDQVGGRTEVRSISFSDRTGFGVDLIVTEYPVIERLQLALAQRGLQLELLSADQQEAGSVRVSFRILDQ